MDEYIEIGDKIGLGITILLLAGFFTITGCTGAKETTNAQPAPAMEQIAVVEQQLPETKIYEPYEHVFFIRYETLSGTQQTKEVTSGQIEIPAGYEILDIESYGADSKTKGFDVWFINNKRVEVNPVYNKSIKGYDYSVPGVVNELEFDEVHVGKSY